MLVAEFATGDTGDALETPRPGPGHLRYRELRTLLASGRFERYEEGRHYVALSLAEAETLRRAVHVRQGRRLLECGDGVDDGDGVDGVDGVTVTVTGGTQLALRVNDDSDTVLDCTSGFPQAPAFAVTSAHAALAFFDGQAYYPEPRLNVLLRALGSNARDSRRRFYAQTLGCRRRLARRWQKTPLSKLFLLLDAHAMLKQRSMAMRIKSAIQQRGWLLFDAFNSKFDTNKNGLLSPGEVGGASATIAWEPTSV